ncbi:hypothetical protein HN766_12030, partial [Candidatus Poribacteria bacterium]|nr:hypothetical protein [Candidatus Poribacteria bacterium]
NSPDVFHSLLHQLRTDGLFRENEDGEPTRVWQSPTGGLPVSFGPYEAVRRAKTLARGSHLDIEVTSPMALRAQVGNGRDRQAPIKEPSFTDLINKSWNRLRTLDRHYADEGASGDAPLARPGRRELQSVRGRWLYHHWTDQEVSSRSAAGRTRVQGVVGVHCAPNYVRAALPLLAYIEEVGIGQMTISGMGRIRVSPVNMP